MQVTRTSIFLKLTERIHGGLECDIRAIQALNSDAFIQRAADPFV